MKRQTPQDEQDQIEARSTRREILRGGLLIAGAAAVGRVAGEPRAAHAADGSALLIGRVNSGSSITTLRVPGQVPGLVVTHDTVDPNSPPDFTFTSALRGDGGSSIGVEGNSASSIGVLGQTGTPFLSDPNSPIQIGVYGASIEAIGVGGRSLHGFGVLGQTGGDLAIDPNEEMPVSGIIGLAGFSGDPNDPGNLAGVVGFAMDPNMPGILARNSSVDGLALDVRGRASFSSAGKGTVPAGADRVAVDHRSVSASSIVLVTLSSDPIGGRRLKHVEVADGGFTVVLSGRAKVPVNFGFLVVN
ncbi:MAG TPA: hypothetical protein VEC57_15740 [Candidatus Limnocylindrales bacterium]|nr:hypothetical protein [Candidatus Limnocylindrales bacterium]